MAENEGNTEMNENVGEIEQEGINPVQQKQAELEEYYKNACTQEVLLLEQIKQTQEKLTQTQEHRQLIANQLELVRSLAA